MNHRRAVLLMVLSLTGTSCLSAAGTLTPKQRETLPVSNHRWVSPTIFRPTAAVPSRPVFQPHPARLNADIVRVGSPVRHQSFAPVFAPGRRAPLPVAKIERSTTR